MPSRRRWDRRSSRTSPSPARAAPTSVRRLVFLLVLENKGAESALEAPSSKGSWATNRSSLAMRPFSAELLARVADNSSIRSTTYWRQREIRLVPEPCSR